MSSVVFFSGGLGSFLAADIIINEHGTTYYGTPRLLFTDTKMEDEDLYRFLQDVERHWSDRIYSGEIDRISDGRTPWEVFKDVKLIGNTRMDPCSRILKRDLAKKWVKRFAPDDTLVFGIGLQEEHRCKAIENNWKPMKCRFPLIEQNVFNVRAAAMERLDEYGIEPPRLYAMGFHHNNCGGFCVKAGHGQFAVLLKQMPARYAFHEQQESLMREYLGKDVSILRDRRGGKTRPMTMADFRRRVNRGDQIDMLDIGGCGCFV